MDFSIRITEDGLPTIDDDFKASTSAKKSKKTDISDIVLYEILEICFSEKDAMSYEPLIENIMFSYGVVLNTSLGVSSAKKLKQKRGIIWVLLVQTT